MWVFVVLVFVWSGSVLCVVLIVVGGGGVVFFLNLN